MEPLYRKMGYVTASFTMSWTPHGLETLSRLEVASSLSGNGSIFVWKSRGEENIDGVKLKHEAIPLRFAVFLFKDILMILARECRSSISAPSKQWAVFAAVDKNTMPWIV